MNHLAYISRPPDERKTLEPSNLPVEVEQVEFNMTDSQQSDVHITRPRTHSNSGSSLDAEDEQHTISPNPIIVNNSGIEGLFDIQRVIVTMIDHEQLRARTAKAVTPRDRISGWCSISTGFAQVIASFSCEKRLLEQELDAVEGIESRILREQYKDKDEKRGAQLLKDMVVSGAGAGSLTQDTVTEEGGKGEDGKDEKADDVEKETDEERLVSRMIEFIQEPQLQLVAGEWYVLLILSRREPERTIGHALTTQFANRVLARFSGVPGARWFLCHLELGSAPGQLYGHRIPTGEIDFANSTPEPGLVKAWQTYMERKKRKMCHVLERYLKSRTSARDREESLKLGKKTVEQATRSMDPFGFTGGGASGDLEKGEQSSDDEGEGGDESPFDKLLDQGKLAARAFGEYTVLAVFEKFFEMRAEHLDKTLSTAVLKRTPKRLQTAVESLNDNKSLLPAMFHSSTRVHMF